jgi:hypothetical protein
MKYCEAIEGLRMEPRVDILAEGEKRFKEQQQWKGRE